MSTVKVNELSTYSGTDISIETGKTVSGTASQFKMTDVVQGDVLYGSAADTLSRLAPGTSGHHLQTAGAGANPVWAAPPAGGLTAASQWRLTTDFTGTVTPIASNLEEVDLPVGFGVLGSSITESSGIFTFPSTGYWYLVFHRFLEWGGNEINGSAKIETTTNDSTYALAAEASQGTYNYAAAAPITGSATASYIFDVTGVTTHKVRFSVAGSDSSTITKGDTAFNETCMTFIKLGDT